MDDSVKDDINLFRPRNQKPLAVSSLRPARKGRPERVRTSFQALNVFEEFARGDFQTGPAQ